MECLEAQELVSAALDNEVSDAPLLEQAKEHCRTCPECAAYVRALVQVRKARMPEPPSDLPDRVIAAVRAQIPDITTADGGPQAPVDRKPVVDPTEMRYTGVGAQPTGTSTPDASRRLMDRLTDPRNRRAVIAWSATAAVVFIATGFGAVAGVRMIMTPRTAGDDVALTFDAGDPAQESAAPQATGDERASGLAQPDAAASSAMVSSSGFIVVDGIVYRSTGVDGSVTRGALTAQGFTDTSLDTGTPPTRRTVYGRGEPARVFLELEGGTMLGFDLVTTTFAGSTYVLRSGPIAGFDAAVSLPRDIPEPSSSDGRPVFEPADPDLQPPVYVRVGSDASQGIALPPGARPEIGASWTWWTPSAR